MPNRYINKENLLRDKEAFPKRSYGFPLWGMITIHVMSLCAILLLIYSGDISSALGIGTVVFLFVLSAVFMFYILFIEREIIMAVEFQNSLYSSAASSGTVFYLIVRADGSLLHSDLYYRDYFRFLSRRGLRGINALIESDGLTERDCDALLNAIAKNEKIVLPFDLARVEAKANANGEKLQYATHSPFVHLVVESMKRPADYIVIRAMEMPKPDPAVELLDRLDIGCYIVDSEGVFRYVNQPFARMLGKRRRNILEAGLRIQDVLNLAKQRYPYSDGNWSGRTSFINQGGQMVETYVHQVELVEADTHITHSGGCVLLHSMASTSLPAADGNEWSNYAEHSPIATIILDEKGNILRSNSAFNALIGSDTATQPSLNLFGIVDEESREALRNTLRIATHQPSRHPGTSLAPCEISMQGNGRETSALLYVSPVSSTRTPDGEQTVCVGHFIDNTEQKNLELRFVHSQKMQAVGQLAGGIAHDFNNLLTAIIGFCDLLLLRHPAGDQSFADIMQIKQNSSRAANLVRQLLAFSRKQTLQPQIINITDVLAELSNLVRRLIGENIELLVNHGRDVGFIRVDQGQLEQVVINLAVNARDAMVNGGVLTIQTRNVRVDKANPINKDLVAPADEESIADDDYVQIDVIDTGHGIPKDLLSKIFEPFFTTKEIGSGTGLGLSTVYGIINQTGGHIYVSSEEGKGTRFSIFFKRYDSQGGQLKTTREQSEADISAAGDLTGQGVVLLVEDEDPVRAFSAQALTNKGYTVLEADCGETAIEIMKRRGKDIDIIITDVVMPGINGPAMIEHVSKEYPNIKVIFISGYAEDAFVRTYGSERNFNFLAKPFTLKQLAAKVKEVLGRK